MRRLLLAAVLVAGCAAGDLLQGASCSSDNDCDPGESCQGGECATESPLRASSISAVPAAATVTTTAGVAPAPASFQIVDSTVSGHDFAIACDNGATASPASGKVSNAKTANISVSVSAPSTSETLLCQITSTTAMSARATFTLTVSVTPVGGGGNPDFSLSATPATPSLQPGGSATSLISLVPSNGFSGAVALSLSGAAPGITASLSSATLTGTSPVTLSLSAASAASGVSSIVLNGTSGALSHSLTVPIAIGSTGGAGPIGPTGGTVDLLDFVLTGDTRPPACQDTAHYPAAVHAQIIKSMAGLAPQFGLDLGDHMYVCNQSASVAQAQMNLYTAALQYFPSYFAMTMGNHECEGGKDCSANTTDVNYATYLSALQQVSKQTSPNYALQIQTRLGRATIVVVADNSFGSAAQSWLSSTLADADAHSKYTIIAKHHPVTGSRPGPAVVWQTIQPHKYSLLLMAHNHDYEHSGSNVTGDGRGVICGLGGANTSHTGFCRVQQTADGQLHFTQYDANANPGDTWAVAPQ